MAGYVHKAPAVLFLHAGVITSRFELKPSKDTAQYAARLVAWALRMQAMKGSPAEVAAARAALEVSCLSMLHQCPAASAAPPWRSFTPA